ncbi:ATPase inhibitor [Vermiconidia calcicola]|uniref:ATPase inhibitor n=1 Tax=Vermiconidia calcicola TaxID=1690605 RepID=A0ACC3NA23_9PEZI|nr:ATPase inhibitor [Vermiconidia calcicola]
MLLRTIRPIISPYNLNKLRPFATTAQCMAAGDTGSLRPGGERAGDSWSRREKAAEDLYIREREKQIMQMLRQKIADQEMKLAKDRAILSAMEDQYGHHAEGKAS